MERPLLDLSLGSELFPSVGVCLSMHGDPSSMATHSDRATLLLVGVAQGPRSDEACTRTLGSPGAAFSRLS